MSLYASWKNRAAMAAVSGGLTGMKFMPDSFLTAFGQWCLREMPYPEGREFLTTILLLAKRHLDRMSPAVQSSVPDFIANALVKGDMKRSRFKEEMGFDPPVLMVISPTMRCNLNCYGCYAGKYANKNDLGIGTLERLLFEVEEMGVYFITISGGEPFVLGDDLLRIMERHPSILFQVYTNGTLIDRDVARRLAGMGNAYPCISVEGFEEETDARRGKGTYEKVLSAMDNLREEGVVFGFSATATRENNELIVSEEFVDFYRAKGCLIGWYFHYVPVGKEPGVELMPTAEQRVFRRQELVKRRARHDILLADFWNDGPMVGGCMAGGRRYLHINSDGEVEPCVFAHFAVDNIKDKPLRDILQSPFFTEIRKRQPYDDNLFRPCMIIDVPEILRDVVTVCGARPTHDGAEAVIEDLAGDIDRYSKSYRKMADPEWSTYCSRDD
ncbi:MAG: radical SAM protein [Actinobacteria bacterium]|nr:radical SAM protein [Actinomycetota bacterium]MBU4490289.1 radical SAM protein [Actinomycetota bacterium]MCG2794649.1 radical SAM protein [Actinomycetes bacterium]